MYILQRMIVKITVAWTVRLLLIFFLHSFRYKIIRTYGKWVGKIWHKQYNGPRKYKDIAIFSSSRGQYTSSPIVPVNTMVWFSIRKSIVSFRCLFMANGVCVRYEPPRSTAFDVNDGQRSPRVTAITVYSRIVCSRKVVVVNTTILRGGIGRRNTRDGQTSVSYSN